MRNKIYTQKRQKAAAEQKEAAQWLYEEGILERRPFRALEDEIDNAKDASAEAEDVSSYENKEDKFDSHGNTCRDRTVLKDLPGVGARLRDRPCVLTWVECVGEASSACRGLAVSDDALHFP